MGKLWFTSKTLWVNALSVVGIVLQGQLGYVITPETQFIVLGLINMVLRAVTKEPVEWN